MNNELVADALRLEDMSLPGSGEAEAVRAVTYLRVSTSRQANKNGEAEGYSIPAQRDACARKVGELGADIIQEFTDAGASARSADRPGLQAMLRFIGENNISYVVVHKLDRLARDRADDVAILLASRAPEPCSSPSRRTSMIPPRESSSTPSWPGWPSTTRPT